MAARTETALQAGFRGTHAWFRAGGRSTVGTDGSAGLAVAAAGSLAPELVERTLGATIGSGAKAFAAQFFGVGPAAVCPFLADLVEARVSPLDAAAGVLER